ncbi:hypothetical protein [Streptomyces fuscigenes]|uniref:hypothetical protein n=1 Tax=Streptomyces fuscigenes TaxID=1528880 RepID=UPI001F3BAB6A|nr:hypothetical protein [Streptomyces fuscigenes]MCF3963328.1 hypothetical protein [Streptomyces fuscigenes]
MQLSEPPDLAHTRPTPMHWLATATVMAGALALAGLLQPQGGATASASASRAGSPAGSSAPPSKAPHLAAPDAGTFRFPLECGTVGTVVTAKASGDLDGDGNPETVAAVRCDSGTGAPPDAVYVLNRDRAGAPRVVATLLGVASRETVGKGFTVRDRAVYATLLGYSSENVPSCCPDVQQHVSWSWRGGVFVRSEQGDSKSV